MVQQEDSFDDLEDKPAVRHSSLVFKQSLPDLYSMVEAYGSNINLRL